ncbi:MAG: aldehyde dehydrogenase family protein [Thermoanaerobaculales bacterium]|jgi:acyl-CoA reductase-like NAD-dependent aldehyde dehydrogenase|nr:aldehyde dehydrogenase family protein [Thermoanaerobaculales bacterium]
MREMQLLLAGQWLDGSDRITVCSPYDGRTVAEVARGGPEILERAASAAQRAAEPTAALPPSERGAILEGTAALVLEHREELATAISEEAGKPISLALGEVDRCADTFTEAAAVARHPEVEARDLAGFASGHGRLALVRRVPVGPVLAITPFNFPLNLVAHKLAPAVAAGCPVVLKPASQTPSPALMLAELMERAGLPAGALSVIPSRGADAEALATDDRFAALTFTGSMDVGWRLKELAWKRRVTLELGGNAAVVVEPDAGDLPEVARTIATAAYAYAGQSCISVQRVLAHEDIYIALRRELTAAVEAVRYGDPVELGVTCGPLIDEANADRVEQWIGDATEAGGRILTGGERNGNVISPALIEEAPHDEPVVADEVFGPVACLDPYEDFAQAVNMVNDSRYGLQAGIFTSDVGKIQRAWEEIETGGIIQGDVPTWRTDPMPYGGVKSSGVGREGPAYTYRELTEERLLVLKD